MQKRTRVLLCTFKNETPPPSGFGGSIAQKDPGPFVHIRPRGARENGYAVGMSVIEDREIVAARDLLDRYRATYGASDDGPIPVDEIAESYPIDFENPESLIETAMTTLGSKM